MASHSDDQTSQPDTSTQPQVRSDGGEPGGDSAPTGRWSALPARAEPDTWIEETETQPPTDPDGGRDPKHEWMLRYS